MKLPAVAIASAFALGIACGLNAEITHRVSSHGFIAFPLCSAATSLLFGFVFAWRSRFAAAGVASLLRWGMLGVPAVCIEEQPRRADYILSLADAGKINLKSFLGSGVATSSSPGSTEKASLCLQAADCGLGISNETIIGHR